MSIETLATIFTIDDGHFKVLLLRKKTDPYKGYWILPSEVLSKEETLEESVNNLITNKLNLPTMELEEVSSFSEIDRVPSKRVIGISFLGYLDSLKIKLDNLYEEDVMEWFDIDTLPKIGYDHMNVIEKSIHELKDKVRYSKSLKELYPGVFTITEIQKVFEQVLAIEMDSASFRKKLLQSETIEDTGDKEPVSSGRPAKLYRFKEEIENKLLF